MAGDRTGPQGPRGPKGDKGDAGRDGPPDQTARDAAQVAKEAADRTEVAAGRTEQAAEVAQHNATRVSAAVSEMRQLRGELSALSVQMRDLPSREELEDRLYDGQRALEYNRRRGIRQLTGLLIIPIILAIGLIILAASNHQNSHTLVECTTPGKAHSASDPFFTGHKCFDDNARRTAQILNRVALNEEVIVQCSVDNANVPAGASFDSAFKKCVASGSKTGGVIK